MNRTSLHLSRSLALLVLLVITVTSCASERVLYDKRSQYNQVIVSEDEQGLRTLRFEEGGARQSVVRPGDADYLGFAYTPIAFSALAVADNPQRFLVVGVGGGTMPMFLRKHYPQATIDAVDIDADVISVAKTYFGLREDERMRAHAMDGRRFIEDAREAYDVIFLDAFGARNVPPPLTTIEFLTAVKRVLKPGGVVIGNVWGERTNTLYQSMVRTYQEVFDDLYILEVGGTSNRILLALPRKVTLTPEEFARLAGRLSVSRKFPFDPALLDYRFVHAERKADEGRVLRDAAVPARS